MQYDVQDDIAVIRMDDGKVNAFSLEAIQEMNAHLDESANAKAVVIAGREGVFSAGFDRKVMLGDDRDAMMTMATAGAKLVTRVYGHPIPVVMACTGHAIALGAIMLMAGDLRIGARGSWSIGMNEMAIGLTLPFWALTLAEWRLDRKQLQMATLAATMYDADGALNVGYLDAVTEPQTTLETALKGAAALTKLDAKAFRYTKENLRGDSIKAMYASIEARAANG